MTYAKINIGKKRRLWIIVHNLSVFSTVYTHVEKYVLTRFLKVINKINKAYYYYYFFLSIIKIYIQGVYT